MPGTDALVTPDGARAHSKRAAAAAKIFDFDTCLEGVTQAAVFEECKLSEYVEAALDGFGVTIFAYGQTGSGKTYTMVGPHLGSATARLQKTQDEDGVLPRVFEYAYKAMTARAHQTQYSAMTSCFEVYNDHVTDLLINGSSPLAVRHNKHSGFYVEGLQTFSCPNPSTALRHMNRALMHRHVRSHRLNQHSSRSHCIMTLHLQATPVNSDATDETHSAPPKRFGFLRLVDLAGSERLKDSGSSDSDAVRETGCINRSLFALGQVLSALALAQSSPSSSPIIPYRDSPLTMLLWDGLKGDGRILMLACAAPEQACVDETLATLHFASLARRLKSSPILLLAPQDLLAHRHPRSAVVRPAC
ncbi:hypothetical protein WJX72_002869 [[Myrmecia] bisecta]|uniref:Kinesin motor domain-containing protein n=1 Tax=[Myrmecia] bisecta TaxID=41462 RepID=A0AAW1QQI2_9CHLO